MSDSTPDESVPGEGMSAETVPDDLMGDQVYQPNGDGSLDERVDVDLDNALDQPLQDETLDEGYSPPEHPREVDDAATTAAGQREGETLDQRLAEEEPDVGEPFGDGIGDQPGMAGEPAAGELAGEWRAGRLAPADGTRGETVSARDAGVAGGSASAEEAAMHLARDPEDDPEADLDWAGGEPEVRREDEPGPPGAGPGPAAPSAQAPTTARSTPTTHPSAHDDAPQTDQGPTNFPDTA